MAQPIPSIEMRCRGCGYNLRGLAMSRCPECQRSYDPSRPETYLSRPVSGRRALALAVLGVFLPAIPLFLAWLEDLMVIDLRQVPAVFMLFGPLLVISGAAMAMHALSMSGRALFGNVAWTVHDRSFVFAFALVCLAGLLALVLRFA